jgi:hypothetical protein
MQPTEALCVGRFQVMRHGAMTSAVCGKPESDTCHNTAGPFPPGPPPLPGINLHEFRSHDEHESSHWKPAFRQPCDSCGMPCAWAHTGEGWTTYRCMECYDKMTTRRVTPPCPDKERRPSPADELCPFCEGELRVNSHRDSSESVCGGCGIRYVRTIDGSRELRIPDYSERYQPPVEYKWRSNQ